MKKIVMIAIALIASFSCSREWDFVNPDVCFFVRNANGDNLLDPAFEGNILENEISVDYKGETYTLNSDTNPSTRANMEIWRGLRVEPYSSLIDETPVLKFGEFRTTSGSGSYHGETFTISWGDGTSDEVAFDLYIKGSHNVQQKIWLNGALKSENSLNIEIVK
jgi:hypothetical protein